MVYPFDAQQQGFQQYQAPDAFMNPTQLGGDSNVTGFGSTPTPTGDFGLNQDFANTPTFGGTPGAGVAETGSGNWWDNALSNEQGGAGWAPAAIGAVGGVAQTWMGFEQLGVAKDQLNFQKNAWQEQFDIQKEQFDLQSSERKARVAANKGKSSRAGG